jgi:2-iminobutanoate/2-iminopropanoate deaminase
MIRHYQPTCMAHSGAPFSQVVIDDHYVHLAGIVAADFPEGLATLGDVAAETGAVLELIGLILAELELTMDRIVRTDVHLASLDDFDAMDAAYREHFETGRYPARTTTESPRLFGGSKVEVTCMVQKHGSQDSR